MYLDYSEVLNYFIHKYGYCRIVDASIHPHKYGMTLVDVIDLGTSIYLNEKISK